MPRPTWDEYFLGIAEAVAARSDCERSKVGAVVVKARRIRATGYNGAPSGLRGCSDCPRRTSQAVPGVSSYSAGETRCVAVHAEANALLYCDREDLVGATLYITREPCPDCSKLVQAAGITDVVWPGKKREPERVGVVINGQVHVYNREPSDGITLAQLRQWQQQSWRNR